MQRNRHAAAKTWSANAQADLDLARVIASQFPARACFHAQQSSEFALKAALIVLTDDHPRTHVADVLVSELIELGESVPREIVVAANQLDLYYTPLKVVQEVDAHAAIEQADAVVTYAMGLVAQSENDSNKPDQAR